MELSDRELAVLEQLEALIRLGKSEQEAAATLRTILGPDSALVGTVLRFRQVIADQRRRVAVGNALFDPEDESKAWYVGPSAHDVFWPALKQYLLQDDSWAQAVPSLDEASTDIVGLLGDPHSPVIRTRGLVLGFVQSGKTANFTATIAKAADAGYRLFIVLSGVHNSLRRQTQLRIDRHLVDLNPNRWVPLTDEKADFGSPVRALPILASPNLRLIAVVKKNVNRLTRLVEWLGEAQKYNALDRSPILIIDDEADQASPNAARDPELDRTRINELLADLLAFPRVSYVGYTATPFANVLVDPSTVLDIYPRSFIYSLPKPPSYFGSRELFGNPVSEDEETAGDAAHDMIRIVSDEEASQHAVKHLETNGVEVTESLEKAIMWFVLATAARRVRSGEVKHSSMLVHTTMRVAAQFEYIDPIRIYIKRMAREYRSGGMEEMRAFWDQETAREPPERHGLAAVSFEDLEEYLPSVLDEVKVLADNGSSAERLVYDDEPATVIAVGGNTLSRGLTLEGLVSSFFLRSSNTYDTLLQMGRWFGYRTGYSDLPRIWTTRQLADDFEFLSGVEDSIREEVERYRTMDGATPMNLPVRIRLHPRMQATSRVKMYFAVQGAASFSAQRPQTTYFNDQDESILDANQEAVRSLITAAKASGAQEDIDGSRVILRGVCAALVRDFISNYQFHPDSEMTSGLLGSYLDTQEAVGALHEWNIAVIGVDKPVRTLPLGLDRESTLITRSKLKRNSEPGKAVIGTLMSKPDRVADLLTSALVKGDTTDSYLQRLRDEEGRGLLVIYPIDKDSQPKQGTKGRGALEAKRDLIGVAFCFPTAVEGSEPQDVIHVDFSHVEDEGTDDFIYQDEEDSRDEVDLSASGGGQGE